MANHCRFPAASATSSNSWSRTPAAVSPRLQIFNAVYGIFDENVDEVVVEGHISKLRKKLRIRLGHDVIDAKRYLGYQFVG